MNDFFENENIQLSNILNEETEFIPLLSAEDEEVMNNETIAEVLPILPLRNTVLFPGVVIPITVGRDKSILLIRDAYRKDKTIGVTSQLDDAVEDPMFDDLNKIGTVAHIIKLLQMPDGSTTAIIQGKKRIRLEEIVETDPYLKAKVTQLHVPPIVDKSQSGMDDFQALVSTVRDMAMQIIQMSPNIPSEAAFALKNIESSNYLINFVSSNLNVDVKEKQKLLEVTDISEKANQILLHMTKQLQMLELKNQIQSKVKTDLDKQQREFLLNQQLKTIQDELGGNPHEQQIATMLEKAKTKKWSEVVEELFKREIGKLQRMNPAAAEYSIQINYVETLLDLPWLEYSKDSFNLKTAQRILNEDHYGIEKVKERILEHLAVLKLKGDMKSPILCLVGPPGVGKTSLGKSIARSLGRNYVRMSLGGVHDEAEVRGHRKTYIGAMPGRILQNIKKAKTSNPVFVLDEIDKVGSNPLHGDPSSALLEALDPEQNNAFYDNYLETEYDLSRVMFIATANTLSPIQPALRDRMEVIEMSGYILEEKLEIAKRHLVPKQLAEHGMADRKLTFSDKALVKIIEDYTRESGVRDLEKKIATVIRKLAKGIAMGSKPSLKITPELIEKHLGARRFQMDKEIGSEFPGVVTGLAWTASGGEILFVEASLSQGKGNLTLTGNLGDVMKESATLAMQYLRSHGDQFGVPQNEIDNFNIHIHVPEGATPKDGPSAGVTLLTALVSAFRKTKIRRDLAMTGEITLRGKVLPVGGIKEKILAARRAHIHEIILSKENKVDVQEIKKDYLTGLKFHYVDTMKDVLRIALGQDKKKVKRG